MNKINIEALKEFLGYDTTLADGVGDAPGQSAGISPVVVPAPVMEQKVVETDGDGLRPGADGDVYLVSAETTASCNARQEATLANAAAALLRVDGDGVYYLPLTDGDGQAWWAPLNREGGWHSITSAADPDDTRTGWPSQAAAESACVQLNRAFGRDYQYTGVAPVTVTACPVVVAAPDPVELIITRHPGLIQYLQEIGLADSSTEVLAHATPDNVRGKHVCGVLPHSLSCLTASFTEVPLAIIAELRGAELTLDQVRQYAGAPVTYRVTVL